MFDILDTALPGLLQIIPKVFVDQRGKFVKTFHKSSFLNMGLETAFKEQYYSVSKQGVIRGMHFQMPPKDHTKVVYALSGKAFDVVLDLRINSPTYGSVATFELCETMGNMLYIPKGFAHGFCSLTERVTLMYQTSTEYNSSLDTGILWSSLPLEWPVRQPILSSRDAGFMSLDDFDSPFKYESKA